MSAGAVATCPNNSLDERQYPLVCLCAEAVGWDTCPAGCSMTLDPRPEGWLAERASVNGDDLSVCHRPWAWAVHRCGRSAWRRHWKLADSDDASKSLIGLGSVRIRSARAQQRQPRDAAHEMQARRCQTAYRKGPQFLGLACHETSPPKSVPIMLPIHSGATRWRAARRPETRRFVGQLGFIRVCGGFRDGVGRRETAIPAEAVRFELTGPCGPPVFKTGAIDHSATLPAPPIVSARVRARINRAAAPARTRPASPRAGRRPRARR